MSEKIFERQCKEPTCRKKFKTKYSFQKFCKLRCREKWRNRKDYIPKFPRLEFFNETERTNCKKCYFFVKDRDDNEICDHKFSFFNGSKIRKLKNFNCLYYRKQD